LKLADLAILELDFVAIFIMVMIQVFFPFQLAGLLTGLGTVDDDVYFFAFWAHQILL
jgi:hypothetical protein